MKTETYEYQSGYARKLRAQGQAKGQVQGRTAAKAADVLTVLDARDIDVPDGARTRITGCSDLDQLERWLRRAATTDSVDELFG